jgi:hypothetical protein
METDEDALTARPDLRVRSKRALTRVEGVYLGALRAVTLIIATGMLAYVAWLAITGAYRSSRDVETVVEAPANVTAEELAELSFAYSGEGGTSPASTQSAKEDKFYKNFLAKYFKLYQTKFEAFKQPSDNAMSKDNFDEKFVHTGERVKAIQDGDLNFAKDEADLQTLYQVIEQAAEIDATKAQLKKYKSTQRQRVEKKIRKTRIESYCSYYGYYIDACIDYDTREVPYTETVVSMQLPKGVRSYTEIFGLFHDNYLMKLQERREANHADAQSRRADIVEDNVAGRAALVQSLQVAAGFLVLMFFFLLIAIERHQRKLAGALSRAPAA